MGLFVDSTPHPVVWHNGLVPANGDRNGGYSSYLGYLPRPHLGIAVLANTLDASGEPATRIGQTLAQLMPH